MNRSFRPKRGQKQDANHQIVSNVLKRRCGGGRKDEFNVFHAYLRGLRVVAYDMSKSGGEMVDWLVLVSWFPIFFEVKAEREVKDFNLLKLSEDERLRTMLKPGEVEFLQTCPAVTAIVTTEDQVFAQINTAADFVFASEEALQRGFGEQPPFQKEFLRLFFPKMATDLLDQPEKESL